MVGHLAILHGKRNYFNSVSACHGCRLPRLQVAMAAGCKVSTCVCMFTPYLHVHVHVHFMYVSPYFSWSAVSCTTSLCPEMSDFYLLVRLDFPNLHVACYCPHHTLHVGLTAGLSMLFYRSNSLSLYVAWKALEVCVCANQMSCADQMIKCLCCTCADQMSLLYMC